MGFRHGPASRQRISFEGLRWGTIGPTDIDLVVDFGGRGWIFGEVKHEHAREHAHPGRPGRPGKLPTGQALLLERLVDLARPAAVAVLLVHDYPPEVDVVAADCVVASYYYTSTWYVPGRPVAFREFVGRFRGKVGA